MRTARPRHGTLACALLSVMVLLAGCGHGLTDTDWSQAVAGAKSVDASLQAGAYDAARTDWKPVDDLIHAAFPKLKKVAPSVADPLWSHMGLVEVGLLNKDYYLAQQGASALPDLLVRAHRAWSQGR